MHSEMGFAFTDEQWQPIAAELQGIGRWDSGGERAGLEMLADFFARGRSRFGKGLPTPKKAREAWLAVASAADELARVIAALPEAGAADFSMLDDHSDRIARWAAFLPSVVHGARLAAEYELHGIEPVANNADPSRDHFLRQLISTWHSYGGMVRASVNGDGEPSGPLVRFVSAIIAPVFAQLGEPAPSANVVRGAIRAHPEREIEQW